MSLKIHCDRPFFIVLGGFPSLFLATFGTEKKSRMATKPRENWQYKKKIETTARDGFSANENPS
jgi:hypothetical protein